VTIVEVPLVIGSGRVSMLLLLQATAVNARDAINRAGTRVAARMGVSFAAGGTRYARSGERRAFMFRVAGIRFNGIHVTGCDLTCVQ
jgi:hypothetical protein